MSSMEVMTPRLSWFMKKMKYKLRLNTHKTDARNCTFLQLNNMLDAEVNELRLAFSQKSKEQIIHECADIANYAMMIADKANSEK